MSDYDDNDQARRAGNKTTIFNNRVKVLLFLMTLATGTLTIWEKCSSLAQKTSTDTAKPAADSSAHVVKSLHRSETTNVAHKRHPKTDSKPATGETQPESRQDGQSGKVVESPFERPILRTSAPLQKTNEEDIEFKLVSAEGSARAQTIKMTVVLTNRAANRYIWSAVHSITDSEGNEYLLRSFTNGASAYDIHVALDTDVPKKCTYTFGGILPTVKLIKLFKLLYRHKSLDDPNSVEFREIPIDWK
jgi:hypothetical protein